MRWKERSVSTTTSAISASATRTSAKAVSERSMTRSSLITEVAVRDSAAGWTSTPA